MACVALFLRNFAYPVHFGAKSLPFFQKILINPSSRYEFTGIFYGSSFATGMIRALRWPSGE